MSSLDKPISTRWRHLLAAVVLLLSTLCCFHQLVLLPEGLLVGPQNGGQNDLTANILPSRGLLRSELQSSGSVPMWQPYELGGIPWLGNPQSAMFYPPNWLYLLTDQVWLASWLMAAHLWLGGCGVYAYSRVLGLRWGAGVIAGCGYLGAPYLIANVCEGHYNPICISAWLPWAMIVFERLRAGKTGAVPLLSLIFAICFFCGHVQEVFYTVLILTFWLLAACLSRKREDGPPARTLLLRWGMVGFLTIGLTSVELIPIYAYTKQAVRSTGLSLEASARFSLDQTSFWQLIDPIIMGGPDEPAESGRFYWETVCHFGLALSLLAMAGILGAWREYGVKRLTITLFCCALFAMGTATPFFGLMFHFVPGISFFRGSARVLMLLSLLVSLLAGFGFQVLFPNNTEKSTRKTRPFAILVPALLAGALLAFVMFNPSEWGQKLAATFNLQKFNRLTIGLGTGGFLVLAVLAFLPRWRWGIAATILGMMFITGESSLHAHRVLRVVPPEQFRGDSQVVQFLKTHAQDARVLVTQELLSDWEAWQHQILKVHGYEPVPPVRSVILIDAVTLKRSPQDELIGIQPTPPAIYHQNVLNLAGVRYAVIFPGGPSLPENWRQVAAGEIPPVVAFSQDAKTLRYEIWENTTALPRAFVLGETTPLDAGKSMSDSLAELDARQAVLVSEDVLPQGARQSFQPAHIVTAGPNEITVEAELDAPGYLVLSDVFAAGWRVKVDGTHRPLLPVNVIFRGVALPAGKYEVVFSYSPPGLWPGAGISFLVVLAVVILFAADRAKSHRDVEPTIVPTPIAK